MKDSSRLCHRVDGIVSWNVKSKPADLPTAVVFGIVSDSRSAAAYFTISAVNLTKIGSIGNGGFQSGKIGVEAFVRYPRFNVRFPVRPLTLKWRLSLRYP